MSLAKVEPRDLVIFKINDFLIDRKLDGVKIDINIVKLYKYIRRITYISRVEVVALILSNKFVKLKDLENAMNLLLNDEDSQFSFATNVGNTNNCLIEQNNNCLIQLEFNMKLGEQYVEISYVDFTITILCNRTSFYENHEIEKITDAENNEIHLPPLDYYLKDIQKLF